VVVGWGGVEVQPYPAPRPACPCIIDPLRPHYRLPPSQAITSPSPHTTTSSHATPPPLPSTATPPPAEASNPHTLRSQGGGGHDGRAREGEGEAQRKKRARLFPPRPPLVEGCSRSSSPPPRHHLDTRRILPAFPRVRHALPVLSARHLHRLLLPPYKRPPPPRLRPWKSFVPSQHRTALLASLALLTATASHRTQPCATFFFSPRATLPSAPFRPPPPRLSFTLCKRTCVGASFGVYRPPRCSPDSVRRLYSVDCSLVCCAHKKGLAARHAEGAQALALEQMRATGFCFGPRAQARSATHCWPRSLARISVEHRHTPALFSTTPHHF